MPHLVQSGGDIRSLLTVASEQMLTEHVHVWFSGPMYADVCQRYFCIAFLCIRVPVLKSALAWKCVHIILSIVKLKDT